MAIAACILALLTAALCVAGIVAKHKRKGWENQNVVCLPFFLAFIGMICGGILSVPTVVCAIDGSWMFAFFGAFVLVCDCMILAYLNCVIRYDDKGFFARNFWGVKRYCTYPEIDCIRSGRSTRVYFDGHSVFIDEISCGAYPFLETMEKSYRRATGRWLPLAGKGKWDPMNGNLENPWFYFFLWVFLILLCLASLTVMILSMSGKTDFDTVTQYTVTFESYEIKGAELHLHSEEEPLSFVIDYYQSYGETLPNPEELCGGEIYHVGTTGTKRYVTSLSDASGKACITDESQRQVYRENQKFAVLFMSIFYVGGIAFSCFGIAVARHPERYNDRVKRLFYRDGVLR